MRRPAFGFDGDAQRAFGGDRLMLSVGSPLIKKRFLFGIEFAAFAPSLPSSSPTT